MPAFLANVGVNAAHAARSPLFEDGTFQLLPIPESTPWAPPMLRLGEPRLKALAAHAPRSWLRRAVHLDPDLRSPVPTYGDNARKAGRAYSLRHARPGDLIVFLARLHPEARPAAFYLVATIEIAEVRADLQADPGPGWWDANAHVRRGRATGRWDSFWLFRGGPASRLLPHALPFGRREAAWIFSEEWCWPAHRTELQTIGSHTRAVRRLTGLAEARMRKLLE